MEKSTLPFVGKSRGTGKLRALRTHPVFRLFFALAMVIGNIAAFAQNAAPPAEAREDTLILDGTGYFRQYTEFGLMKLNGEILKNEGEKLFGQRFKELERNSKRLLGPKNFDWTKTDWREEAVYHFPSIQAGGDDSLAMSLLPTVPPPADWAKPGFDDAAFLRQRLGILSPLTTAWGAGRARSSVHRRALYARTYFEVPDPAKATDLTLRVVYRGGVRVFLNGEELAHAHLPEGVRGPERYATDYPQDAYLANADELPGNKDGNMVGDLRCPFDLARPSSKVKGCSEAYGGSFVNRAGWERLMKLRDRELGPLLLPARALRKGVNVLALEIRSSRYHPLIVPGAGDVKARGWNSSDGSNGSLDWDHLRLVNVELKSFSNSVPSVRKRPQGVQLWAEDVHNRLFDRDFNPVGWPAGSLRLVAAQNGSYAAQFGLSTDKQLSGLKAEVSELCGPGGVKIPASSMQIQYMIGHGLDELSQLGWFRSFNTQRREICSMSNVALYRYADGLNVYGKLPADAKAVLAAKTQFLKDFKFFDHITANPPAKVPANTCQPLWLTLHAPADAAPGAYKGVVTLRADNCQPLSLPLEAEIISWRVPGPLDFQMNVESEQSPYGVAKAYKCELWSERHFELMESSFKQLARLGSDWVFVPVLMHSELGNKGDPGPLKWLRGKDGTLSFDYTLLDRYLALAQKHLGRPKVICFLIMHGDQSPSNAVQIFNEATGKNEVVEVGPAQEAARGPLWRSFGVALFAHMKSLGLHNSLYFGHPFDDTFDPALIALMAEVLPEVGWATSGHMRRPDATFRAAAGVMGPDLGPKSMSGWMNQFLYFLTPRTGGSVLCVEGISTPFTWRVWCDRAIYAGMNGLGRVGADYFEGAWLEGVKSIGYNQVGRPCVQTLWPGESGVESGARNEVLLEGIQEAEARIFLEQALARKILSENLAAETQKVLDEHFRATLYIAAGGVDNLTMDTHGDWQARSRRLYQAAARVASQIGLDVNRTTFGRTKTATFHGGNEGKVGERLGGAAVRVPALGKTRLALKLRNWTTAPRSFKAVSDTSWIVPELASGTVTGQMELGILLDGKTLKAGTDVSGSLAVTDTVSGTSYSVDIDARVDTAMEFRVGQKVEYETGGGSGASGRHDVVIQSNPVFNVQLNQSETRTYLLANNTDSTLPWKISCSQDWFATEPAVGDLPAGATVPVKIVARPNDKKGAIHEVSLTLNVGGGAVAETYSFKVFVIPPYQAPSAPQGEAVFLNDLDQKKFLKAHFEKGQDGKDKAVRNQFFSPCFHRVRAYGENLNQIKEYTGAIEKWPAVPFTMSNKTFTRGLWVYPGHETIYNIENAGFTAFAAEVGFFDKFAKGHGANAGALVDFEIYVDGKLCSQSGLMGVSDAPRLLVAVNLQGVKELKLVTRRDNLLNDSACLATWGDPRFIKAK